MHVPMPGCTQVHTHTHTTPPPWAHRELMGNSDRHPSLRLAPDPGPDPTLRFHLPQPLCAAPPPNKVKHAMETPRLSEQDLGQPALLSKVKRPKRGPRISRPEATTPCGWDPQIRLGDAAHTRGLLLKRGPPSPGRSLVPGHRARPQEPREAGVCAGTGPSPQADTATPRPPPGAPSCSQVSQAAPSSLPKGWLWAGARSGAGWGQGGGSPRVGRTRTSIRVRPAALDPGVSGAASGGGGTGRRKRRRALGNLFLPNPQAPGF